MIQVQTNISVDPSTNRIAVNIWCLDREDCNNHERRQAKHVEKIVLSLMLSAAKKAGFEILESNFINTKKSEGE